MADYKEQFLQGGKHGAQSTGKLAGVFILFFMTNLFLFGFLLYKVGFGGGLVAVLLGSLFTAFAVHRAYFVVLIDTGKFFYDRFSPLFYQFCMRIVDRASISDIDEKKLAQVIDFPSILSGASPK